ncbi:SNF2-related protein (plasmid) [Streptosporangium sandarakinum]|uniref:SNF2-related protein n=1 Tax=Streptosporangium sandarakinum TaxID=1260955 RepID=UPI003D92B11A
MTSTGGWETKLRRAAWEADEHPRDRKGRWIETGATVTVWGGGRGTVVGNVGGGRLEVRFEDGSTARVHRNYLTVEKSAAGAKPTGRAEARPKPLKVTKPSADAQDYTPAARDSRTKVSDLVPGTAVLLYGEDEEGNDVARVGVVRSVTPDPERGQRVELGAGGDTTTVYAGGDEATARPIPAEQLQALNAAIRQGDAGADRMARDLLAAIVDADDREAEGDSDDQEAERPAPAAKTPAAPQTVVPGDLERGDRVTFDVPVTAANAERFAGTGAKNPPRLGATVTVRGVVEGVETDMFGGSRVHLRRDGAQWQSTGGGGRLDGDGLEWLLDEDHAVHKTGKAEAPQQTRRGGSVQTAPQGGLFSDAEVPRGREEQGTEDMFAAHERDQQAEQDKPRPPARPGGVEADIRAAYDRLASQPGDWVGLARLRAELGDTGTDDARRREVDAALRQMIHAPDVSLVPENNQKVLTSEARDAALRRGDQDMHLIAIGDHDAIETGRAERSRNRAAEHTRRAQEALDAGDYQGALDAMHEAEMADPSSVSGPEWEARRQEALQALADASRAHLADLTDEELEQRLADARRRLDTLDGEEWERARDDIDDMVDEQHARTSNPRRAAGTSPRRDAAPDGNEQGRQPAEVAQPEDTPAPEPDRAVQGEERAKELSKQSREAFDAGDYGRALALHDEAAAAWPEMRGRARQRFDRIRSFIEQKKDEKDRQEQARLLVNQAGEAVDAGDLDRAEALIREAEQVDGRDRSDLRDLIADKRVEAEAAPDKMMGESSPIDTERDQSATVRSTMRAPKTGQAQNDPDQDEGARPSERVREDRDEALGDVPADRPGRAGEPDAVLRGAGRAGGAADRGPVAGDGRGREAGRELPGDDGPQPDGDGPSPRTGDGRRSVPARGAGPGGRGTSAPRVTPKPAQGRFRPQSQEDLAPRGERAKARANVEAVKTLRALQEEGRRPSAEERQALARWSGWGSVPVMFADRPKRAGYKTDAAYERALARWESFSPERDELRSLLDDKEWRAASRNTLNAHYTDASIVDAVWEAVKGLGFDGGNVLEPGSGVGTFIGLAPQRAHMTGIELDPTTAAISKALYPHAEVRNESFADTRAPEGAFDLTVGNVPFGDYKLTDREHNAGKHSIHNHFILKSLALTRPGGLVAVVTSRYTMDSEGSKAREEMAATADLVGAVRLPSGAHQRAAGTDVVTDLLIFRKRAEGEEPGDTSWVDSVPIDVNGHQVPVNAYFAQHPERVLGEMTTGRGQFTDHDLIVKGDRDAGPAMREALAAVVAQANAAGKGYTPQGATDAASSDTEGLGFQPLKLADRAREHEGYISVTDDGTFTQVVGGQVVPVDVHPSQAEQLTAYAGLRDTVMQLLDEEGASSGDTPRLRALRQELNTRYRAYTSRWEAISKPRNRIFTPPEASAAAKAEGRTVDDSEKVLTATALFRQDPASAAVFALDRWDPDTKTARPADILKQRVVAVREMPTSADSPADALAIVMDRFGGEVVLSEIARLLGVDEDEARRELGTSVFEEPPPLGKPRTGRLVPAAAYLSGNVRAKLVEARAAADDDPALAVNVAALEKVLPRDLTPGEIDARMGAPWIGEGVVAEFLRDILGTSDVRVEHAGGSTWEVQGPKWGVAATSTWGTEDRPAPDIAQAILQQQTIKVTRTVKLPDGSKKSVPDPGATLEAQQKAQEMSERFSEWVWENPERAERLARIYNDKFNSIVLRSYDGIEPALPGLAAGWTPREHQKAAVTRILSEPSVLLAHEVGAGKTAEMVMGAMELRRTGMAKKPAIVVPNHMLEQFSREFLELYPQAKILAAGSSDLTGDKRREFVARAATGDWDAVILTQRAFEAIDMRPEAQEAYMNEELDKLRAQIARAKEREGKSLTLKRLENALQKAEEKLKAKLDGKKDEGAVYFEQTGIDYLMVDEAHHYKNLRTPSRIEGAGIDGSNRASDLHMKLHYLRSQSTSGRVVTLATGTPIANSVTEAFTMLRYLRPDLLEAADIDDFDSWAATFGDIVTDVELNPDGNGFRQKSRFAKFRNVPELLRLYRVSADVKTAADLKLPTPPVRKDANGNRGETIVIPASEEQLAYIQALGVRAEKVRNGAVKPDEDNMLKISGDGKRAALDMRLLDPNADGTGGKIDVASDKIAEIYAETKDLEYPVAGGGPDDEMHPVKGALQIVFMDQGTPKPKGKGKKKPADGETEAVAGDGDVSTWAAYDEMKRQLVARGVPEEKIRYIHEANTDQQKAKLFEDARNGKIAVLIGSTEKMGVGTNVQARAVALHHMDCPWRPADLAQRDGRIERQGNLNAKMHSKDVRILRYVTEGTFDGYSWQTVERKAKFIAQLQRGNLDVREIEDVGDAALSFAEVKALATGNPYLLDKAKADADLNRLERLDRAWGRNQGSLTQQVGTLESNISMTGDFIGQWERALAARVDTRGDAFTMTFNGQAVSKRADAHTPLEQAVQELRDARPFIEGQRVVIGQLGGHDVIAETGRESRGGNSFQVVRVGFDWPRGTSSYLFKDLGEGSGRRLLSQLENRLGALETQIDAGHAQIDNWETELGRARAAIGQPFPQADKLSAARTRARLLSDVINAQTRRDELKGNPDSDEYKAASAEVQVLEARLEESRPAEVRDPAADPDPDIAPVVVDTTPVLGSDGEAFTDPGDDEAEQERRERSRRAAENLSQQARTAVDEGDFEGALALIDDAEELDPDARDWDAIRDIVREQQSAPARDEQPAGDVPDPTPDDQDAQDAQDDQDDRDGQAAAAPARAGQRRRSAPPQRPGARPARPGSSGRARAGDPEPDSTAPDERPGGDPVDGAAPAGRPDTAPPAPTPLRPVPASEREAAPEGQVYADQVQAGDTLSAAPLASSVDPGRRVGSRGTYVQPGGPARIRPQGAATRTVTDVVPTSGGQRVKITFDDGTTLSRLADELLTRGEPAEVLDQDGNPIGEWMSHKLIKRGDRISYQVAGQDLPSTIDREQLGVGAYERVTVTGQVVRRQPGMPSGELVDITVTRADGTSVPIDGQARTRWPARVIRLHPTAGHDQDQRQAEEAAPPVMPEDLAEGDRLPEVPDGPAGVVEETTTTPDGDTTLITVRGDDDARHVRGTPAGEPVAVDDTARPEPAVDETEPDGLTVGDFYLDEDGQTLRVASEPEVDGDRVRFDVTNLDGLTTEVEMDRRVLLTRVSGPQAAPEPDPVVEEPPAPAAPPAPTVYVPVEAVPDGTATGKVRLRTDQRKRTLGLDLDAEGADVDPEVGQAAARLRARQPLTASQIRALADHLRSLAADESLPGARRRSYGRTASWVDAAYARVSGFPAPPHDPGRAAPEKAYAGNLGMGDVIALPDDTNPDQVVFGTVTVVRKVRGFNLVQVHVRLDDGTVAQKVLPDKVDMWVMPDLPDDVDVPPAGAADPDFPPMEHITPDRLEVGDAIAHPIDNGRYPYSKVASITKTSPPFADVDEWRAVLEVLDDDDQPVARETVTLSSRGRPSVVRTWRGPASESQPWDAVIDNSSGDGIITSEQLRVGDRVSLRRAQGETSGTVEMIAPVVGETGPVGVTAVLRLTDGEIDMVPLIDGDGTEILRLAKGADNAEALIHAQMDRDHQRERQRAVTRALADAETGLYRDVATRILGELDTVPVAPARDRDGDEVYQQALTLLEGVLEQQPEGLADRAAAALTDDAGQAAVLARRLAPTIGEIRDRAAANMVAAIGEIDPMPGETWDRALRRVMRQYRDTPPSASLARAGKALAAADLGDVDAPLPEVTVDAADLPGRLAAYRKALPEDLANLGRKQVNRSVFRPASLEDLEAGRVPERDTITAWVDDVAADGGPGEHAMRHLAVLRAAGADLDAIYRARYEAADPKGIVADFDAVSERARERMAEAFVADRNLLAAKKATRTQVAEQFGYPSMRALTAEASPQVKRKAQKAWEEAYAGELAARDEALTAYRAAADDVLANLRARREARRQAAMETLASVRDLGGEGLTYRGTGTSFPLSEQNRLAEAMRIAEASYPADWLTLAREAGPVRVESGRGYYKPSDGVFIPEIALPWEATPNDVPRDGRFVEEEATGSQFVGGNNASRGSVHELGHHMETVVPGLLAAERAFLWDRTSTGPVGERERHPLKETTNGTEPVHYRDGGFESPYSGREYGSDHYEVFTVGVESLMGGSHHLDDDPDYRAFTLGALALLGTGHDGPRRSPLTGVNLSELSEEELRALLSRVWGNPDEVAQVMAALERVEPADDPLAGVQLERMDLDELVSLLGTVDDDYSIARISAAMEAWEAERAEADAEDQAFAERSARVDELIADGMPEMEAWAQVHGLSYEQLERDQRAGDSDRLPGETREQMARRHYDLWLHQQYLQAEADTRGYMLTPEGVAAGIDEKSLFSGRRDRARKYATEELRNWFDANGWMNFTEFKAQMLGRERDKKAAAAGRGARDFNR